MTGLRERWNRFFTEPIAPLTAFQISRGFLCGVRYSRKERRIAAHVLRPLPPGTLDPGFDRPNVVNAPALEAALRDVGRRLGAAEMMVSLLIPETAVKTVLLTFETLPTVPEEREAVLRWKLAKTLPLKFSDLRLSFDVMKSGGGEKAFCVLAPESVVREYEQAFGRAGLRVRQVAIPTPHLLGLVPASGPADILIVNIEEDHLSLFAAGEGGPILFRVKAFAPAAAAGGGPWPLVATEVANTTHFLEDRENFRIKAIWVRDAEGNAPPALDILEKRAGCPVRTFAFSEPAVAGPKEQALLAPLVGQMS